MIKIIPKIKKWPQQWEEHVLNTGQFYFENHSISLDDFHYYNQCTTDNNTSQILENDEISLYFSYKQYNYSARLKYVKNAIRIKVYKKYTIAENEHHSIYYTISGNISVLTPYQSCQIIEKIILLDNEDRNDGDEDDVDSPAPSYSRPLATV